MYDWDTYKEEKQKMNQNKVSYWVPVSINKEKSTMRYIITELLDFKDKKRSFVHHAGINLLKGKENHVIIRVLTLIISKNTCEKFKGKKSKPRRISIIIATDI